MAKKQGNRGARQQARRNAQAKASAPKQSKRAAQRNDFKNQNIQSAKDFDFNQHGENHVSGREVRFLRGRHKEGGGNLRDTYDALQAQRESGAKFGKRAQKQYDRMGKRIQKLDARAAAKEKAQAAQGSSGQVENAIDQTQTGQNDSVPANDQMNYAAVMPSDYDQHNSGNPQNNQEQRVNQDNDINTNVNGDNNTVITEQDNSIRQYGGDNRSFVYNGSGDTAGTDMPATMATLAGFFAPDDSPAAQAKFNDMYTSMNADNQKRYAGDAMKTFAKYGNLDARGYTPEAMATAIGRSTQYSYDKADEQTGFVFGDVWNPNYITEKWQMPEAPKPIESNAEEIADKAKEDIEDID
jgi:hypothetical protein